MTTHKENKSRYINPYTAFGFKRLFGIEANKDLLIDFLNQDFQSTFKKTLKILMLIIFYKSAGLLLVNRHKLTELSADASAITLASALNAISVIQS